MNANKTFGEWIAEQGIEDRYEVYLNETAYGKYLREKGYRIDALYARRYELVAELALVDARIDTLKRSL